MTWYKYKISSMVYGCALQIVCCCCSPRVIIYDSSGYATYDRQARKLDIIWERHAKSSVVEHDTVYVVRDSLSVF